MKIFVNGDASEVPDALTVRSLLEHLGLTSGLVAVEVNKAIVVRSSHASHVICEGDSVELVRLVGGG